MGSFYEELLSLGLWVEGLGFFLRLQIAKAVDGRNFDEAA